MPHLPEDPELATSQAAPTAEATALKKPSSPRDALIRKKLKRLREPNTLPQVLDLFSGCGGFSLGFQRAGCKIIGGVELDKHAAKSHALNFHGELEGSKLYEKHQKHRDITKQDPHDLLRDLGHEKTTEAIDFLIGGPPCPAFARVGRAKLREIHEHPEAFKKDPRAQLYVPYLQYVRELAPVALVMENVPDILNYGGHNLAEEICDVLEDLGYRCAYTLLNSANYGVPQMRERFFLIGIHKLAGAEVRFPAPLCHVSFPPGYQGTRDVALKHIDTESQDGSRYVETPSQDDLDPATHPPVTVADAISDLPEITVHLTGDLKKGARDLGEGGAVDYDLSRTRSRYVVEHMIGWPGLTTGRDSCVTAHVIRTLSTRDYRLFRLMEHDDQYPQAYALARNLFSDRLDQMRKLQVSFPEETPEAMALAAYMETVHATLLQVISSESSPEGVYEQWENGRALVEGYANAKLRYEGAASVLRTLRLQAGKDAGIIDGHSIKADLLDDWRLIYRCLQAAIGDLPLTPTSGLVSKMTRAANALLRVLRRQEAYGKEEQQGLFASAGIVDRSIEAWPSSKEASPILKKLRADLELHAEKHAEEAMPRLLVLRLADMLLIRMSQRLGEHLTLKAAYIPPYDPNKFPNKWRKMHPDWPARTLMAHLGKDSYSHIHFDREQARTLSVREAARLQSFPDRFEFTGSMNPGFRQVGNAVPPLMSYALAQTLCEQVLTATEVPNEASEDATLQMELSPDAQHERAEEPV